MPFNLLTTAWIPARRRSGVLDFVAPAAICASHPDPVVALDWPRADFRIAGLEFLMGLHATACPSRTHAEWLDCWNHPPEEAVLQAAFAPFAAAFNLDGDGPRFLQDHEDFAVEANPIATLLIESPGDSTLKQNRDLLVKRGRVNALSRAAAAMALFTLQSQAPSGGAGNRTSLRGGGPLTTLAIPPGTDDQPLPLWHLIWANVPCGDPPAPADLPRVFPWLAPTRLSDKGGRATTPADAHGLQVWWGMPRRIRLDFSANPDTSPCDLTGISDSVTVRTWRQRPWGVNYQLWQHPLTPYYCTKPTEPPLPVHPQPGGIGYQHWVGLAIPGGPTRIPAAAVTTYREDRWKEIRRADRRPWRLLAVGFDMDNMKARGFVEGEMPVNDPADLRAAQKLDDFAAVLVEAAHLVAGLLVRCIRGAVYGKETGMDTAPLAAWRECFWSDTADAFFAALAQAAATAPSAEGRRTWLDTLAREARRLFAEAAPVDASGEGHPERITANARYLGITLAGYGKEGAALFSALGLVLPEQKKPKARKGKGP